MIKFMLVGIAVCWLAFFFAPTIISFVRKKKAERKDDKES